MTARKIIAAFDSAAVAQNARQRLLDLGLPPDRVQIIDQSAMQSLETKTTEARGSFWSSIKAMFMPDEDRSTLEESIRRGGCALIATVGDREVDPAIAALEDAGAIDLDQREMQWRGEGWKGGAQAEPPAPPPRADTGDQTIPIVEERLRVGKREVNRGGVRVRSYLVEEPVHEEVRLREERVEVERRPVNEPARPVPEGSPEDLMKERSVELTESAEEAVVAKDAVVTEEVTLRKRADERVEKIDEKVRHTEVEVDDTRANKDTTRQKPTPQQPRR